MSGRNPYWKARLERWQLWVFTGPGGTPPAEYIERVDCAVIVGTLTPAINDEALVTDQLVARLPRELKRTVKEFYLNRTGRSAEMIAIRIGVTQRTLHNRLCQADGELEQLLADRQQLAELRKAERRAA